ncbi:nucleotide 5'-monophosphate nucleosidase PpnN [Bowmanella sp. JS7-9]|uniref:AMP nucleosidase n=1 Tax=Pseudobowmanella zhangzhouensis TaxID=1537679 RepID=A0ABW1XKC7_9ALTE|nr:nucleotide 5'-monophosphate nucleosidase PpnN [Bowmanella sp. JS7-9]TBX25651.1 LOG family protein [Bowmanella sp. JS7-9]
MKSVKLNPVGSMSLLSQYEVDRLMHSTTSELYQLARNCCLAVLNSGAEIDNPEEIFKPYEDFDIRILQKERGIKIELTNPPELAFVDDVLIRGAHEHLFAVIRDLLHMSAKYDMGAKTANDSGHITHMVFDMLRNAEVFKPENDPNMVVCWGGHSINDVEYQYTKKVGYELGLREMNICTGCGPGAMKGPMKGATIGHAKQRYRNGRYLGVTEPGIIAAEPPNAIVNELVIMPDIEKRLEAFVRLAQGIVIFPGGAGTAEELLYLLGIMLNEQNKHQCLPLVLTGPEESRAYFESIDEFVGATLGPQAQSLYTIVVGDAAAAARKIKEQQSKLLEYRRATGDSYHFNWSLKIESEFQAPFYPSHENVAGLDLHFEQPVSALAANLRRAFSAIVAGNVKAEGLREIRKNGKYQINGDPKIMAMLDDLLRSFVEQQRMKLPGSAYNPCYEVVR